MFTSFAPTIAGAASAEQRNYNLEIPEGYDFAYGTVIAHNLVSGQSYEGVVMQSQVTFNRLPLGVNATYGVEAFITYGKNADATDILTYYDYQELSGSELAQLETFTIAENAKILTVDRSSIPLESNYSLKLIPKNNVGVNSYIQASKILTSEDSLNIMVTGQNQSQQQYLIHTSIGTNTTDPISFADAFTQAIPFSFEMGDATINNIQLTSNAYSAYVGVNVPYNGPLYVTPGDYKINFHTTASLQNGTFYGWWYKPSIVIDKATTIEAPLVPNEVNIKGINWNSYGEGHGGAVTVEYSNNGYILSSSSGNVISAQLDIVDPNEQQVYSNRSSFLSNPGFWFNESFSGVGTMNLTLYNGGEELARTSKSFELQDQTDTNIHGVVVTAEAQPGLPLTDGYVYVLERVNQDMYANYEENYYYVSSMFEAPIQEVDGAYEAFIPNALLIAGREYEVVVDGYNAQDEKIYYHSSIKADSLSTIDFKADQLTELTLQTNKSVEVGRAGLVVVDAESKNYLSWPLHVNPNEKVYISTNKHVVANAQLIDTDQDTGYYYSQLLTFDDNKTKTINLDELDQELIKLEAPKGYEDAKIGIGKLWWIPQKASTYYVTDFSKIPMGKSFDLDIDIHANGFLYQLQKYVYDINGLNNLEEDIKQPFDGGLYFQYINPETNEASYYTSYQNDRDIYLENVELDYPAPVSDDMYFNVMGSDGKIKKMKIGEDGRYSAVHELTNVSTDSLLNYQIYQNQVAIGDVIPTNLVHNVKFVHPEQKGQYQLVLEEQLFPNNVVTLHMNRSFEVGSNTSNMKQLTLSYSNSDYRLNNNLNVKLVEVSKQDGQSYRGSEFYLNPTNIPGQYAIGAPIKPDAEYYLVVNGSVQGPYESTGLLAYEKMTGAEFLALSEYVINHEELAAISFVNETKAKEDVRNRLLVTLEDQVTQTVSLYGNTKNAMLVTLGTYEPILEGMNGSDAYSYKYPKQNITKAKTIKLTDIPTVTINVEKNGQEIPFKGFGVIYGNIGYHNEIDYRYQKRVLRQLHMTPGETSLIMSIVGIEENDTPWLYSLYTDRRDFKSNTTLQFTGEFTGQEAYYYDHRADEGYFYINGRADFRSGDFTLTRVAVAKVDNYRGYNEIAQSSQPIRDYGDKFTRFEYLNGIIRITDESGKEVHKAEANQNVGYFYYYKKLAPGKYTLSYEMPVGPMKSATYSKVFDVIEANNPFVTLQAPANNSVTTNKTITVSGKSNPDVTVTVKAFQEGTTTLVTQQNVVTNDEGDFTTTLNVANDGAYDLIGYQGDVQSNKVTITVDSTPPASPTNVKVEQVSNTLKVSWDVISDAASYKVEMAIGNEPFQTVAEAVTTNEYVHQTIQPATTYKFRITAKDAAGNVSAPSTTISFTTSSFVATKLDVVGAKSIFNLYKIDQELAIGLEGSYQSGYTAKALVIYEENGAAATKEVALTYNEETKSYQGKFLITEGIAKINKVEGWIVSDQAEETNKLTKEVNTVVGATITGQVTEAGDDLTTKAIVRLVGSRTISIDTDGKGHFSGEGLPQGDYSVNVIYGGKTFYNVLTNKITLANGLNKDLQQGISLPLYRDVTLKFVEKGTEQTPTRQLNAQVYNNAGYIQYGYINDQGYFSTWGNVTTLKGLATGEYHVKVSRQGLYKDTTATFTVTKDSTNPIVLEVDKMTNEASTVSLQFTNENLESIDYVSLVSWSTYYNNDYSAAGYYSYHYEDLQDGALSIPDVVHADDYQLNIYKDGYRQYRQYPVTIDSTTQTLQITLDEGRTITGKIVDGNGKEISGAQISAYSNTSYGNGTSNQDGGFELKGLDSNEKVTLNVSNPNYLRFDRTYDPTELENDVEIVLNKASFVHGKVVDKNNKPMKFVSVYVYEPVAEGSNEKLGNYKAWARTGSDGYFKISGLAEGQYDLQISNNQLPELIERNVPTETDGLMYILQEKGQGSFVGEGNSLKASKQTVVPGKTISYVLSYKNNGTADETNVPLQVNLPAHVKVLSDTVQLNGQKVAWNNGAITVDAVAKGKGGTLKFEAEVLQTSESLVQATATINDSAEKRAEVLSAVTNILFVTINAPTQTATKKIKVYGNAKTGSAVEVYANGTLVSTVQVEGRWWFADITLPVKDATAEESFTLVAKVLDGTESVTSEKVAVKYSPSIPQIEDLTVYAGWNGNVKINPYTGLATFAVTEKTPLDTTVDFNEAIDSASITFLGETYDMIASADKKKFTFDGRRLGDWSSYGEQLLELTFKKGDITITLPIMEIIVLIDPSGFVFEGSMDQPLAGVTAVVEQLVNGEWVKWNAEFFGQVNPQTTDENGRYGWDVIQGDWRVIFTKDGYEPYISRIVTVPPPETQLNVPMVRTTDPRVTSITPAANSTVESNAAISVTFDRLMSTADKAANLKLYKISGNERTIVPGTVHATEVNGYKQTDGATGFFEEDSTKKLAKTFTFVPNSALEAGATYELEVSDKFADYGGKQLGETELQRFTVKTVTPPPGGDNGGGGGGGIVIPIPTPTPNPTEPVVTNGVMELTDKWVTVKDNKGTVNEEAVLAAINKATALEKIVIKANVSDVAISAKLVKALADKNNKAMIVIENELGSLTLPVSALDVADINVSIVKSARSFLEKGVAVLSSPVDFLVTATVDGKTKAVTTFKGFVERTIALNEAANASKATAVKLTDAGFVGVPTVFSGKTATIRSNTLGTYVVVQGERTFEDVNNGKNWAESYIETLASKYIIKGKSETIYGPSEGMTRSQFAILIARALGLTPSGEYKGQFKDISVEQGAGDYAVVIAAYEAGIIQGRPDGTFGPNATITRTQAAAMLARAMKLVGYEASKLNGSKKVADFKDGAKVQEWAVADIELIVQAGIMSGNEEGNLNPNHPTKRDQMAKMLAEFLVFVGLMNK
ncbi:S-layer homology domain-containing protein [Pseudoneobacillus sp. C159]